MSSKGIPGYDFGTTETVTAALLQQWLEDAEFTDVDSDEAEITAGYAAIWRQDTDPGASEGRLWWHSSSGVMQVATRWGWTRIFDPWRWETRRMVYRDQAIRIGHGVRPYTAGLGGAVPSVTNGTALLIEGGSISSVKGDHYVFGLNAETCESGAHFAVVGWGVAQGRLNTTSSLPPGRLLRVGDNDGQLHDTTSLAGSEAAWGLCAVLLDGWSFLADTNTRPVWFHGGPVDVISGDL